jgi:hypothetical protein
MYGYNNFSSHNGITTVNVDIVLSSPLNEKFDFYGIVIIIIITMFAIAQMLVPRPDVFWRQMLSEGKLMFLTEFIMLNYVTKSVNNILKIIKGILLFRPPVAIMLLIFSIMYSVYFL